MGRVLVPFIFVVGLLACGGGSDGDSSAVAGTWRGELLQGVTTCADGSILPACASCSIGQVELFVEGGDEVGTAVSARDGECLLKGTRTTAGFSAVVVEGCNTALAGINFELLDEDRAGVSYQYDISKAPQAAGQITCVPSPSAEVTR